MGVKGTGAAARMALAVVLVGVMAETGISATAAARSPLTITFGSWGGSAENQQLLAIVQQINARNRGRFILKNININSNYEQKLEVELAANSAPDIFYANNSMLPTFESQHVLFNISPYLSHHKNAQYLDAVEDPANYLPVTLREATYRGQYYALPWIAMPVVTYVNPVLFRKAHLALPSTSWTWGDFVKDARAITDAKAGVYGYLQANGWPPVNLYIWSYGGHILNASGTKSTVDSSQAIAGLTLMSTFVKDGIVPPQAAIANVAIEDLFRAGKLGMFIGGADDGVYNTRGFKATVATVPRGTRQANFLWMADLAVNRRAPDKNVVMDAYFQLLAAIDHWKIVSPVLPFANARVIESVNLHNPHAPSGHTPASRIAVIMSSLRHARRYRMLKNAAQMAKYWTVLANDLYEPILLQKATPAQAARTAAKDLDAIIASTH